MRKFNKRSKKRNLLNITLGIIIALVGLISGIILIRYPQLFLQKALVLDYFPPAPPPPMYCAQDNPVQSQIRIDGLCSNDLQTYCTQLTLNIVNIDRPERRTCEACGWRTIGIGRCMNIRNIDRSACRPKTNADKCEHVDVDNFL